MDVPEWLRVAIGEAMVLLRDNKPVLAYNVLRDAKEKLDREPGG